MSCTSSASPARPRSPSRPLPRRTRARRSPTTPWANSTRHGREEEGSPRRVPARRQPTEGPPLRRRRRQAHRRTDPQSVRPSATRDDDGGGSAAVGEATGASAWNGSVPGPRESVAPAQAVAGGRCVAVTGRSPWRMRHGRRGPLRRHGAVGDGSAPTAAGRATPAALGRDACPFRGWGRRGLRAVLAVRRGMPGGGRRRCGAAGRSPVVDGWAVEHFAERQPGAPPRGSPCTPAAVEAVG